jgi:hypothetical protein
MAGDYIPATNNLSRKPKTLQIARITNRSRHEVVGMLLEFWGWASDHTADGLLPGTTLGDLCDALGFDAQFFDAVVTAGWLMVNEDGIDIPDADIWITKGAKARLKQRDRTRLSRSGRDESVTESLPNETKRNETKRNETKVKETKGSSRQTSDVDVGDQKEISAEEVRRLAHGVCQTVNAKAPQDRALVLKVCILAQTGQIAEHALHDSLEAVRQTKPRKRIAYFQTSLSNILAEKYDQKLNALLKSITLPEELANPPPRPRSAK